MKRTINIKMLIILICGFVLSAVGFCLPMAYWSSYTANNGAIGIIGGAEAPSYRLPSYRFMLSTLFEGLPLVFIMVGIGLILPSAFCLLFPKTVQNHCDIRSSAMSLGLSSLGACGIFCLLTWYVSVAFGEGASHPVARAVSISLGVFCFSAFIVLSALYLKLRKKNWSVIGVIIDVATAIVYLPVFFFVGAYLCEMIA